MKLIDKDPLVAEIERLKAELPKNRGYKRNAYNHVLHIISTLEVKEVDLEKEYKDFVEEDAVYNKLVNGIVGKAIAKHFFELGLKAKQG